MSAGPALNTGEVARRLSVAGCIAAREEANELVAAAGDPATLEDWVRRREQGEPFAWITGTLRFCGLELSIAPGVYVPRLQSQELARRAASVLANGARAADLCTGAGAVAAHLRAAVPGARVVGVDLDPRAVACARRNGVPAVVGDLGAPLQSGVFDLVTAVTPYVPADELGVLPADVLRYEPRLALDGGADGLDLVRRLVHEAARLLRPGGWVVTELGGEQDRALTPALTEAGFGRVETWADEDGDLRGLMAQAR